MSNRPMSSFAEKLWLAWFILIAAAVYSPWAAPYGQHEPFTLGLPFTLFWWMLLCLLLIVSILFFVIYWWREEN